MSIMITDAMEAAIIAWVTAASGGVPVRWAGQNDERPPAPFIEVDIPSVKRVGFDWTRITNNPSPTPGAEIISTVEGERAVMVSLKCFAASATSTGRAVSILDDVITRAGLPAQVSAFRAAGIMSPIFDTIQTVGDKFKIARFEPRAFVQGVMYLKASASETATFIEFVELKDEIRDSSTWVPEDPSP